VEELQLALTSARIDQRNFGLWINNWQVGQTLNALVTSQRPSGELVLRVGGQQITATSDIPIQQGTQLLLEVKQLRPTPTLRILSPAVTPATADTVGGTLRLLPASGGALASPSLAGVMEAAQSAPARGALPPVVGDALGQLLRLATRPAALGRPESLAAAVRDSGLFLEPRLASAAPQASASGMDLKAGLFRALGRVDAALSQAQALSLPGADVQALLELKRELEGGLGRISLNQLASQPADGQGAGRQWFLDIPVQLGSSFHSLQVTVEEDGAGPEPVQGDEERGWRVRLQLTPPALGNLDISLALRGGQVNLQMSVERAETRSALDSGLTRLADALASRGLSLGQVGSALQDSHEAPAPAPRPGVDIRA
jgi:hypothetical protein